MPRLKLPYVSFLTFNFNNRVLHYHRESGVHTGPILNGGMQKRYKGYEARQCVRMGSLIGHKRVKARNHVFHVLGDDLQNEHGGDGARQCVRFRSSVVSLVITVSGRDLQ